jgi:hypothetical protein
LIVETKENTAELIVRMKKNCREMRIYNLSTREISYFSYNVEELLESINGVCL